MGSDNKDGEVFSTKLLTSDSEISLPSGDYTVQVEANDYVTTYLNIGVSEEEKVENTVYMVSNPSEGEIVVVLTWNGDVDLDIRANKPDQKYNDVSYIGGLNTEDFYENKLVHDNNRECEVVKLRTTDAGNYNISVIDYSNSVLENGNTSAMSEANASVYIYNCSGLVGYYRYPNGMTGLSWNVVDIEGDGKTLDPKQEVTAEPLYIYVEKGEALRNVYEEKLRQSLSGSGNFDGENDSPLKALLRRLTFRNGNHYVLNYEIDKIISGDADSFLNWGNSSYLYRCPPETEMYDDYQNYVQYIPVSGLEHDFFSISGKHVDLTTAKSARTYTGDEFKVCEWQGTECLMITYTAAGGSEESYGCGEVTAIEYIDDYTWDVTMEIYAYPGAGIFCGNGELCGTVTYTLRANPSSYYGFNVVGCQFDEYYDLSDYVQLFSDYENILYELKREINGSPCEYGDSINYVLLQLDDDYFPELAYEDPKDLFFHVLSYKDGAIRETVIPEAWWRIGIAKYVPYGNSIYFTSGGGVTDLDSVYYDENEYYVFFVKNITEIKGDAHCEVVMYGICDSETGETLYEEERFVEGYDVDAKWVAFWDGVDDEKLQYQTY